MREGLVGIVEGGRSLNSGGGSEERFGESQLNARTLWVHTQLKSLPPLIDVARKCWSGPTQALKVSPFSTRCLVSGFFAISVASSHAR